MNRIAEEIETWMADPTNNALEPGSSLPAFAKPLVGCANGDDKLFDFLKTDIGAGFYWTPVEAFSLAFPEDPARSDELSVIAWILPQTEHTRLAHRQAKELPSIEWSKVRHYGEMVNENLRRHVVDLLMDQGYQACAPVLLPQWSRALSEKYGFACSWSERHTAHVCGLGTFGISDGLITPAGKAVRVGSVIVRKRFTPTQRHYTSHNEWCLFQATGRCLQCQHRCPAGAISKAGHDKIKCKEYIRNITASYVEREQLGVRVNSCGFCQTGVPCENRNPLSRKKK